MNHEDIQRMCIVYGDRTAIQRFLNVNGQALDEALESRMELMEVKPKTEWFRELKKAVWKGRDE